MSENLTWTEIKHLAKESKLAPSLVYKRLKRGWDLDKALSPLKQTKLTRKLTHQGITLSLKDWADIKGLKYETLYSRIYNQGWSVSRAIEAPKHHKLFTDKSQIMFNGEVRSVSEWAEYLGINRATLYKRLERGWDTYRALTGFKEGYEAERMSKDPKILRFKGKRQTVKEWAKELGINEKTIRSRLSKLGWSTYKALSTPVRERKKI